MKRLILAGFAVFFLVLLVTFPARVAYRLFAPPALQMSGITGSVWNGRAAEALAADAYLTDVRWRLKPDSLLSGNVTYAAQARPVGGSLATDVSASTDGSITLTGLTASVPLDLVLPQFQAQGIGGDLMVVLDRLVITDGTPADISGTVTVVNLFVPILSAGVLGDYQLHFESSPEGITATLAALEGLLDISGTLTLRPDGEYRVDGLVRARPEAPPSVESRLASLGTPDQNGMRPFQTEGRL